MFMQENETHSYVLYSFSDFLEALIFFVWSDGIELGFLLPVNILLNRFFFLGELGGFMEMCMFYDFIRCVDRNRFICCSRPMSFSMLWIDCPFLLLS